MISHMARCLRHASFLTKYSSVRPLYVQAARFNQCENANESVELENSQIQYVETDKLNHFIKATEVDERRAISDLMNLLHVTPITAKEVVEQYPNFKSVPKAALYLNFKLLREAGVYKSTIKDNPFVLTCTTDILQKKIHIMKDINIEINDSIHLFNLQFSSLWRFVQRSKAEVTYLSSPTRIHYLAEKLNLTISEACRRAVSQPHMLILPAPKILSVTEYLLEAGMPPEHIVNDLGVYKYHISTMKEKVERAHQAGMRVLKPWVVRITDEMWDKIQQKHDNRIKWLDPKDTVPDIFCKIFKCDREIVDFLIQRDPSLKTMNTIQLVRKCSMFSEYGYNVYDLVRAPHTIHRNIKTLENMFNEWKQSGLKLLPLSKYVLNKAKFTEYLKAAREDLSNKDQSNKDQS